MTKQTNKNAQKTNKSPIVTIKRRLGAMLYDWLLCLACLFVFTGIAVTLNKGNPMSPQQQPFLNIGLIGVVFAYFIGFWRQGGQTPGMKVWKVTLVADQTPASVDKLFIRFMIMFITFGLAIVPCFFRPDKKGLHDIVSKTSLRLTN
ncbi:MAG: RDD family protein [Gammaproteobacteria bacterium]|nr:RDD family protein [Gammaproteobacteria bacterium]